MVFAICFQYVIVKGKNGRAARLRLYKTFQEQMVQLFIKLSNINMIQYTEAAWAIMTRRNEI